MSTTQRAPRATTASASAFPQAMIAAMIAADVVYGLSRPLYKKLASFGTVKPVNTIDSAFEGYKGAMDNLKDNQAGYVFSEINGRTAFTLAMKIAGGGIAFANLKHDADGQPETETDLTLVHVEAVRDFDLDGEVIIKQGRQFIKAVPAAYAASLAA